MKTTFLHLLLLLCFSFSFLNLSAQVVYDAELNERKAFTYHQEELVSFKNLIVGNTYTFNFSGPGVLSHSFIEMNDNDISFVSNEKYMLRFTPTKSDVSGIIKDLSWNDESEKEMHGVLMPEIAFSMVDSSGIEIIDSQNIQNIVDEILLGDKCISVGTVKITGDPAGIGKFSNGLSSVSLDNGLILSSGAVINALGPNEQSGTSTALGADGDDDMEQLSGNTTRDCSIVEFDFVPDQDSISFEYVFASEEYCDFTFSSFNDGFGFFLSGDGINGPFSDNAVNLAYLPDGTTPVTINNVNWGTNGEYYIDNTPTTFNASGGCTPEEIANEPFAEQFIEYDAFTTVLTAKSAVTPCTPYHIKLVVCDAVDQVYDSAVFIGKNSFTSGDDGAVEATIGYTNTFENEAQEGCNRAYIAFERFDDSADSIVIIDIHTDTSSTATADVDYITIPDSFVIGSGVWQDTLWIDIFTDGLTEGIEVINLGISGLCACLNTLHQIFIDDPMGEVEVYQTYDLCPGDSIDINGVVYNESGTFEQTIESDVGCDTILTLDIFDILGTHEEVYYTLESGETISINGEEYSTAGVYTQNLIGVNGCDSLLTIAISSNHNIVYHSLNSCSALTDISNINYDEFTPEYPESLDCGSVVSSNVYRLNPEVNSHSCTPGLDGNATMCVSSLDNCTYEAGSEKAVLLDITLYPEADFQIQLTGFNFYENAPDEFNWINGSSGTNNPPTLYGFRVLKDGAEIFSSVDIPTSNSFSYQEFSFDGLDEFTITDTTMLTFELLGYCLEGNGSPVSAWDLDEINISALCEPVGGINKMIQGQIMTYNGEEAIENVEVKRKWNTAETETEYTFSNDSGNYSFPINPFYESYIISGNKTDQILHGVSTLDLVLIQKHILEIEKFDDAHQYLSADINGSGDITGQDLLHLRKLILGIDQAFPNNKSWLFLDASHELSIENPWFYHAEIGIEELANDILNADFNAIKIGDVNESYKSNYSVLNDNRNLDEINLQYEDQQLIAGSNTTISFYVDQGIHIEGMQLKLFVEGMEIEKISASMLDLDKSQYHLNNSNELSIAWNQLEGKSFNAGEALFSIQVKPSFNGVLSGKIALEDIGFVNEAYETGTLKSQKLKLFELQKGETAAALLYQNQPNPFSHSTVLKFFIPEEGMAEIQIADVQGKLVYQLEEQFVYGMHEVPVALSSYVNSNGVFFCKLIYKDQIQIIKILKL